MIQYRPSEWYIHIPKDVFKNLEVINHPSAKELITFIGSNLYNNESKNWFRDTFSHHLPDQSCNSIIQNFH